MPPRPTGGSRPRRLLIARKTASRRAAPARRSQTSFAAESTARRRLSRQGLRHSLATHTKKRRPSNFVRSTANRAVAVRFAARITRPASRVKYATGELVEVEIAVAGAGQLELRSPQLLVLHVQLDLVDLQFVDQLLHVLDPHGGHVGARRLDQPLRACRSPLVCFAPAIASCLGIFSFASSF